MAHREEFVADPNLKPIVQSLMPCEVGAICELCVHKSFKWPGIRYACYRGSRAGSLVVAVMLFIHKLLGTWSKKVTAYIALTEFQKQKMIEGGLPGDKIWVKPNFIQRSEVGGLRSEDRGQKAEVGGQKADEEELSADIRSLISDKKPYCLFVGRLSPEKGCDVLIRAWSLFEQKLTSVACPLTSDDQKPQLLIVGDGSERDSLEKLASHPTSHFQHPTIHFLGKKPKNEVLHLMRLAQFLVFPSICYETFGLTVVEAGLQDTPSLISDCSVAATFIKDGETGVLFKTDDAEDLSKKLEWALGHPDKMQQMGQNAQKVFEEKYSAEENYQQSIDVFTGVRQKTQGMM